VDPLRKWWTQFDDGIRALAQRPAGHVVLLFLAALMWTFLWAWFDGMVARRAFPPPSPPSNIGFYWGATWRVVFPLTTLFAFRRHAWLPILAVTVGGWGDILFYWILGEPVPRFVPWLAPTSTDDLLYLKATLFLAASIIAEVASHSPALNRLPPRLRALVLVLALLSVLEVILVFNTSFLVPFLLLVVPFYVVLGRFLKHMETPGTTWQPWPRLFP